MSKKQRCFLSTIPCFRLDAIDGWLQGANTSPGDTLRTNPVVTTQCLHLAMVWGISLMSVPQGWTFTIIKVYLRNKPYLSFSLSRLFFPQLSNGCVLPSRPSLLIRMHLSHLASHMCLWPESRIHPLPNQAPRICKFMGDNCGWSLPRGTSTSWLFTLMCRHLTIRPAALSCTHEGLF